MTNFQTSLSPRPSSLHIPNISPIIDKWKLLKRRRPGRRRRSLWLNRAISIMMATTPWWNNQWNTVRAGIPHFFSSPIRPRLQGRTRATTKVKISSHLRRVTTMGKRQRARAHVVRGKRGQAWHFHQKKMSPNLLKTIVLRTCSAHSGMKLAWRPLMKKPNFRPRTSRRPKNSSSCKENKKRPNAVNSKNVSSKSRKC